MHADVAEIALHDRVGGQDEGDIARARLSARPDQDAAAHDGCPEEQQRDVLRGAGRGSADPGAVGAVAPFGENPGEAGILTSPPRRTP